MASRLVTLALLFAGCGSTTDATSDATEAPAVTASQASLAGPASASVVPSAATAEAKATSRDPEPAPPTTLPSSELASVSTGKSVASASAGATADADPSPRPTDCARDVDGLGLEDTTDPRLAHKRIVVVSKAARRLAVYTDRKNVACYAVGLGFAPTGHKQIEGDGRTPEGWYRTSDKPWSVFDNAIAIHYPNREDADAAARDGRISKAMRERIATDLRSGRVPPQSTKMGGAVLIHGGGSSSDWTLGCVALDDDDLLDLRRVLARGMKTDLLILP